MNVRCFGYKALDWFRFTPVAKYTFYRGDQVQCLARDVIVTGTVCNKPENAEDGDVTFGITLDPAMWPDDPVRFRHCEVTPCASDAVKVVARHLQNGDAVVVYGDHRWDPGHLLGGKTGWKEIHPVTGITVTKTKGSYGEAA